MSVEKYKQFLDIVDDDLRKIFDYQKEYLSCKMGCAHCCKRGNFPMTQLEFDYLMQAYNALDNETKNIIKKNIEIVKQGNLDSYICPFLINDICSVYNNRPLVCRAFGVLTEDASGNPSFPFCATMGLNFSKIYDEKEEHLSAKLVEENHYKIFPRIFRLSNKVIMNLPLAKELELDFGQAKRMIDFL